MILYIPYSSTRVHVYMQPRGVLHKASACRQYQRRRTLRTNAVLAEHAPPASTQFSCPLAATACCKKADRPVIPSRGRHPVHNISTNSVGVQTNIFWEGVDRFVVHSRVDQYFVVFRHGMESRDGMAPQTIDGIINIV